MIVWINCRLPPVTCGQLNLTLLPIEVGSLRTLGKTLRNFFQTTPAAFPQFVPYCPHYSPLLPPYIWPYCPDYSLWPGCARCPPGVPGSARTPGPWAGWRSGWLTGGLDRNYRWGLVPTIGKASVKKNNWKCDFTAQNLFVNLKEAPKQTLCSLQASDMLHIASWPMLKTSCTVSSTSVVEIVTATLKIPTGLGLEHAKKKRWLKYVSLLAELGH